MSYITYLQTEDLLRKHPMLKALLANLQVELSTVYAAGIDWAGSEEEILYSLSIGNRVLTDMPFVNSPTPGNKETGIIAVDTREREYRRTIKDIMAEINIIGPAVEQITYALKCLTIDEQELLQDSYWQNKTLKQLRAKCCLGTTQVKENRRKAIYKLVKVLRITQEQYQFCVEMLKGEN